MLDDVSALDQSLPYRMHRLGRLLRYHLQRFLLEVGETITPEQWFILFALRGTDGRSQTDLTDPTLDDRPNITRIVAGLEAAELVRRDPDPSDGRRRIVRLTPAGEALLDRVLAHAARERGRMFDGLSAADLEVLDRATRTVERNLRQA